jgi:hypothetical protein
LWISEENLAKKAIMLLVELYLCTYQVILWIYILIYLCEITLLAFGWKKKPVKCQKFDCCSSYFSQWTPIVLTLIYCTVKHDFLGTNFCVLNRQVFSLYMLMDHLNITYFWFYLNETTNTCMDWDVHQTVRYDIVVELLWCEQFSINMKCVKTYI